MLCKIMLTCIFVYIVESGVKVKKQKKSFTVCLSITVVATPHCSSNMKWVRHSIGQAANYIVCLDKSEMEDMQYLQ